MDIRRTQFASAEEYIQFVKTFVTLLDTQFAIWEEMANSKEMLGGLVQQMPAIISLVNTVGYLRGQDGVFLNVRPPKVSEFQKELYTYEDQFEVRLKRLIETILSSDEKGSYTERLERYFITARTS